MLLAQGYPCYWPQVWLIAAWKSTLEKQMLVERNVDLVRKASNLGRRWIHVPQTNSEDSAWPWKLLKGKEGSNLFNYWSQFISVQSLSRVWLFGTPWIAACQASLSITNSRSSLTLMSIESVMPSSHLILCRPLLLLPPIPPSITVFSKESTLRMRWPKFWSFSFSIIPSKDIRAERKKYIFNGVKIKKNREPVSQRLNTK